MYEALIHKTDHKILHKYIEVNIPEDFWSYVDICRNISISCQADFLCCTNIPLKIFTTFLLVGALLAIENVENITTYYR